MMSLRTRTPLQLLATRGTGIGEDETRFGRRNRRLGLDLWPGIAQEL